MFRPDNALAPPEAAFREPWQAQALAMADCLVRAGAFSAAAWAETLGAALKAAEERKEPDDTDTYYHAVVEALESLSERSVGISAKDRAERRSAWEHAYRNTEHGKPVTLIE